MNIRTVLSAAVLCTFLAPGLSHTQAPRDSQGSIFTTQTTVVLVPALVRDKSGAVAYTLKPEDFRLTDDGFVQKLELDADSGSVPLALVVVLEVGGAGARQFQNYDTLAPPLAPMLSSIVGNVRHRIAVVTFDSSPTLLQPFTSDIDEAAGALRSLRLGCTRQEYYENCTGPHPVHDVPLGDNGAAILDSLAFAVNLLRAEPPAYRRAILLVSETLDRGSQTTIEQAVRAVTESNTTIYTIAFSTAKSEASHYAARQLPTQPNSRTTSWNGLLISKTIIPIRPTAAWAKIQNPTPTRPPANGRSSMTASDSSCLRLRSRRWPPSPPRTAFRRMCLPQSRASRVASISSLQMTRPWSAIWQSSAIACPTATC